MTITPKPIMAHKDHAVELDQMEEVTNKPYPKAVFFIVVTEFCERFSYYGMRAVLTIYMRNILNFSEDLSTTIYHVFLMLCYGLPVFGGIIADNFLGKYKTIVAASIIFTLGNFVLTLSSVPPVNLPTVPLCIVGLLLMGIGTSGIKPCVCPLGGEQFRIPGHEKELKQFFSLFVFTVSIGSMVSTVITPVLRRDVECFGQDTCYPLAFGIPSILMIVAIDQAVDHESGQKKLPYPKSVFFIVTNEFCERFSYYGMKAVLTLYLKNVLDFNEDSATVIYHVFSMCCYFTPVFGAMLADSLLGKFRTIFYLSIIYAAGNIVLSLAATPPLSLPAVPFSLLGLGLIAIGTGGIKPCVAAFGGDQFVLPQQAAQLVTFFSFFYMAINSGSLISTAITPIMRKDIKCFDDDTCYALAFGIPAVLMIVSLLVFLLGRPLYRIVNPSGNVVVKVCKCIGHAISRKGKTKREHWLDNADDEYDQRFIEDVKILLRVLVLYLPLPVFWALFDQQGSRWTLQATRMDGVTFGYTIKPDQVQVLNPALILIFIPLFDKIVYPLAAKCNILKRPLQRLTIGGILAGVAFVISGIVELELEKTYPNRLELSEANINFINGLPCPIELRINGHDKITLNPSGFHAFEKVPATTYNFTADFDYVRNGIINYKLGVDCDFEHSSLDQWTIDTVKTDHELAEHEGEDASKEGGGFTYLISPLPDKNLQVVHTDVSDDREKPKEGNPKVKFLTGGKICHGESTYFRLDDKKADKDKDFEFPLIRFNRSGEIDNDYYGYGYFTETEEVEPIEYQLQFFHEGAEPEILAELELKLGGSYIISVVKKFDSLSCANMNATEFNVTVHTITEPSTLHMLWLLPQYVVITAAEIMFSITGLEFSYSQSPVSMKSVLQSCWLLTVAFGNLIVVIVAEAKFFQEQSKEFFLFAGLMFVDMVWFIYMAWRYVPAQLEDPSKKKDDEDSNANKQ